MSEQMARVVNLFSKVLVDFTKKEKCRRVFCIFAKTHTFTYSGFLNGDIP